MWGPWQFQGAVYAWQDCIEYCTASLILVQAKECMSWMIPQGDILIKYSCSLGAPRNIKISHPNPLPSGERVGVRGKVYFRVKYLNKNSLYHLIDRHFKCTVLSPCDTSAVFAENSSFAVFRSRDAKKWVNKQNNSLWLNVLHTNLSPVSRNFPHFLGI